jgi:hypothetical protein
MSVVASESSVQIWRVRPFGRFGSLVVAAGSIILAAGITFGATHEGLGVVAVLWIYASMVSVGVWRGAFVPYIAVMPEAVVIQNPIVRLKVPWTDITGAGSGYYGLRIERKSGNSITAWAVQKSNTARWGHKRVRADDVANVIMERVGRTRDV